MNRAAPSFAGLLFAALSLPAVAFADLAPPPNLVVETCTTGNRALEGETCVSCGAHVGAPKKCAETYAPKGYASRCRTVGASVWTEIWCAPTAALITDAGRPQLAARPAPPQKLIKAQMEVTPKETPTPEKAEPKGCQGTPGGTGGAAWLLMLPVAFVGRRLRARGERS